MVPRLAYAQGLDQCEGVGERLDAEVVSRLQTAADREAAQNETRLAGPLSRDCLDCLPHAVELSGHRDREADHGRTQLPAEPDDLP